MIYIDLWFCIRIPVKCTTISLQKHTKLIGSVSRSTNEVYRHDAPYSGDGPKDHVPLYGLLLRRVDADHEMVGTDRCGQKLYNGRQPDGHLEGLRVDRCHGDGDTGTEWQEPRVRCAVARSVQLAGVSRDQHAQVELVVCNQRNNRFV